MSEPRYVQPFIQIAVGSDHTTGQDLLYALDQRGQIWVRLWDSVQQDYYWQSLVHERRQP